jgi:hypothetical protein
MFVDVKPMPAAFLRMPFRLLPTHPPIFDGGDPTPADRQLALDLWRALDVDSRRWYAPDGKTFAGLPLSRADISALRRGPTKRSSK